VSQAQTAVATAQQNLASTKLIAPFDGTVAALNNQAGDLAGSGTSSTTAAVVLNTPDQVVLNMTIGETDYNSVKAGQTGTAVFAGIPGRTFPIVIDSIGTNPTTTQGVVSYVAQAHFVAGAPNAARANASTTPGAAAQGSGTSGTRAGAGSAAATPQASASSATGTTPAADATPAAIQKPAPGMNATITIVTAESQNVLMVPNAAVQRTGQTRVLQVKQSDGTVQQVTVQVGLSDTKNTEITSGVTQGQTVVLPGVVATSSATAGTGATTGSGATGGGFGGVGGGAGRAAGAAAAGGN
jgi:multidrug efflux pump subunit AcrA (membrane-fusion protein)